MVEQSKEVKFPDLKWAQRKDRVMLTVDVPDIEKHDISLTDEGKLILSAETTNQKFGFEMEFFAEIVKEESAWTTKGRTIQFNLIKKDAEAEYWTRLTKEKTKNARITTDWGKWVDEDEEDEEGEKGMDGFDANQMNQFGGGGMPGMGGMGGMPGMGGMGGMPGMGGMGGMPGMEGMPPNMSMMGMPGAPGGGMDMNAMQEMMKNMGGGAGMGGMPGMGGAEMPDSDDEDEEEEAAGEPMKAKNDGLGDLDQEAEASTKKEDNDLD